ncbi:zonadhesin-like isoform X3 [Gossypium australe]|uniref:Zonadhesin-like isoform X3 n=1 Tax=Gossypium australe TaxID=47621 RepID=A0A5B6V5G0_9ROSI|nr:zonadhesin-like isoform X3 [Gossypium australe]
MPGFSLDAPPNLRTTLPDRPLSATRGRPGAPSARSSSVEPGAIGRLRRQSCSPSRGRLPNGAMLHLSGGSVPAVSHGYSKASDNVSPVVIGAKMVERVINMRKLAPPKQDDKNSPQGNSSGKSASPDSSGFGRTLSKKSLDMAIRHMDIRRSIPGNLRPLMTNIPASSMYSVRSGHTRSRTISVLDSPLATSSNGSSELSVNNNGHCFDGSEVEDDNGSERVGRSPSRKARWMVEHVSSPNSTRLNRQSNLSNQWNSEGPNLEHSPPLMYHNSNLDFDFDSSSFRFPNLQDFSKAFSAVLLNCKTTQNSERSIPTWSGK